jgi:hypothetical protein
VPAEAPSHPELAGLFFINAESGHGEESGCGGANREARECKPNKQNRTAKTGTVPSQSALLPALQSKAGHGEEEEDQERASVFDDLRLYLAANHLQESVTMSSHNVFC